MTGLAWSFHAVTVLLAFILSLWSPQGVSVARMPSNFGYFSVVPLASAILLGLVLKYIRAVPQR